MRDILDEIDSLTHIKWALTDLRETMAVIYEGLYKGEMTESSPHCILTLQTAVDNIIRMVEEEQQRIKEEGHED